MTIESLNCRSFFTRKRSSYSLFPSNRCCVLVCDTPEQEVRSISMNIDTSRSKSSQNNLSALPHADPVIAVLIPKQRTTTTEKLEQNVDEPRDQGCCSILGRWWNVQYQCQRAIVHFVKKSLFHIAIVVLVLIHCLLIIAEIILDFIKLKQPCDLRTVIHANQHDKKDNNEIELAIEILHYSSLALLTVFLIEVLAKIYAFGRHWWNPHDKKMEWFDATIVITSFVIDLVMLYKSNVLIEIFLLFISFRLWRLVCCYCS
jgi:hypothetical protein